MSLDNEFWALVHNCTSQDGGDWPKGSVEALEEHVEDLIFLATKEATTLLVQVIQHAIAHHEHLTPSDIERYCKAIAPYVSSPRFKQELPR